MMMLSPGGRWRSLPLAMVMTETWWFSVSQSAQQHHLGPSNFEVHLFGLSSTQGLGFCSLQCVVTDSLDRVVRCWDGSQTLNQPSLHRYINTTVRGHWGHNFAFCPWLKSPGLSLFGSFLVEFTACVTLGARQHWIRRINSVIQQHKLSLTDQRENPLPEPTLVEDLQSQI